MKPKKNLPTIADVAHHAGVSIATVSRVLNKTVPVQEEKVERVRLAMDELNFVPRHAARVLASKKTNTIGLLLPEISGAFFQPMLKGIDEGAREAGYDLLIHSTKTSGRHPLGESVMPTRLYPCPPPQRRAVHWARQTPNTFTQTKLDCFAAHQIPRPPVRQDDISDRTWRRGKS